MAETKVSQLQELLLDDLLRLLREGAATAADRNVIRQLLKDSGMSPTQKPDKLSELAAKAPDFPEDPVEAGLIN